MSDVETAIACAGTFHEYSASLEQVKGLCWRCGVALPPRRRHWCSDDCGQWWRNNHDWNSAREVALKRDKHRCVKCGADGYPISSSLYRGSYTGRTMFPVKLEVNHIVPREGKGYGQGCHNHQENLETLCHNCHVAVTRRQRKLQKAQKRMHETNRL